MACSAAACISTSMASSFFLSTSLLSASFCRWPCSMVAMPELIAAPPAPMARPAVNKPPTLEVMSSIFVMPFTTSPAGILPQATIITTAVASPASRVKLAFTIATCVSSAPKASAMPPMSWPANAGSMSTAPVMTPTKPDRVEPSLSALSLSIPNSTSILLISLPTAVENESIGS